MHESAPKSRAAAAWGRKREGSSGALRSCLRATAATALSQESLRHRSGPPGRQGRRLTGLLLEGHAACHMSVSPGPPSRRAGDDQT